MFKCLVVRVVFTNVRNSTKNVHFGMWCMFQDANQIKKIVRLSWSAAGDGMPSFKNGRADLVHFIFLVTFAPPILF